MHILLRFHTGCCFLGLKGQRQAEDGGFGPIGQGDEVYEYPESILRFIIIPEQWKFQILCVLNQLSKAQQPISTGI